MDGFGQIAIDDQAQLGLRMLGSFEVQIKGKPVPNKAWGRRKTQDLLKGSPAR